MQQAGVYGVTKVSLVKQKISCCKCLFQNTVIVQDGSIYGLEVIIVDNDIYAKVLLNI